MKKPVENHSYQVSFCFNDKPNTVNSVLVDGPGPSEAVSWLKDKLRHPLTVTKTVLVK